MLVPLLGDRRAHHLVSGTCLGAAQPAVTDRLFDGSKTRVIADLQDPGEGCDRANARNCFQPFQALGKQRIFLQRADQGIIEPLRSHDLFASQFEQRADTLADVLISRKQLGEVTRPVQSLFVIAHPSLHQQAGDAILRLHQLLDRIAPGKAIIF